MQEGQRQRIADTTNRSIMHGYIQHIAIGMHPTKNDAQQSHTAGQYRDDTAATPNPRTDACKFLFRDLQYMQTNLQKVHIHTLNNEREWEPCAKCRTSS